MSKEEIESKMKTTALLAQLDELVLEERKEEPKQTEDDAIIYYSNIANSGVLKFFEKERDKYLMGCREPQFDPRGLKAVRDMAILEYIQKNINTIKKLMK